MARTDTALCLEKEAWVEPSLTCLVTIHGMGFQQAPSAAEPGYADGLHERLQDILPDLSGDPVSEFGRPVGQGAVYVHSDWPPDSRRMEEGLRRLGAWKSDRRGDDEIDITGVPLAQKGGRIAHVAMVYSHLEDQGPHLGATTETFAKAVVSHGHYAAITSIVHMGIVDVWSALRHRDRSTDDATPSLRVRADAARKTAHPNADGNPSGLLSVLQALDHDVATYVCRNDLRARVHDFLSEALLRVCCRPDVSTVVINAHSLGTVLAFDALRALPAFAFKNVQCFVTAGSPLRKYTDLFYWGEDAGRLVGIPWHNFWDSTDPVADPLAPPKEWRRGSPPVQDSAHPTLYYSYNPDTGNEEDARLTDHEVQNSAHGAGGGLPAHNYWDNQDQFVAPLAGYVSNA